MHNYQYIKYDPNPKSNKQTSFIFDSHITALDSQSFGPKILNFDSFIKEFYQVLDRHDFSKNKHPSSFLLDIPKAIPYLSGEFGLATLNPENYLCRLYRNKVQLFLNRKLALPVTECKVRVYSKEFYFSRSAISQSDKDRVISMNPDYVIMEIYTMELEDDKEYIMIAD